MNTNLNAKEICLNPTLYEHSLVEDTPFMTTIKGKHFLQMSREERLYLMLFKSNICKNTIKFSKHSLQRMNGRFISENQVLATVKKGQIIDYRISNGSPLILIKSSFIKSAKRQVIVAFSLTNNTVITVYCKHLDKNKFKKKHLKKYQSDFDIHIPDFYKKKIFFDYVSVIV